MTQTASAPHRGGLPFALGAYFLWGVLPLYLVLLNAVNPYRLVAWRVLWTVPICFVVLVAMRKLGSVTTALRDRRAVFMLLVSAVLISINWVVYIVAVQAGHFYAASLGYYINPLVNVLLGTVFLKERLSRLQWIAVAVAAAGIAVLVVEATASLAISLTLPLSFALYGLVRKKVAVDSLPGLTVEALLLAIPAALLLLIVPEGPADFGYSLNVSLLLIGAGGMTAVPLLLFAVAARRMTYSALGFVQFLAPSMVFLLGLFWFGEELKAAQLFCFVLIWTAVVLFCVDIVARGRKRRPVDPI
ncbi:EamA family transporter RarD [Croceicoccus naphthovorans]|uniref:Membrane protein n=1 Tax=Croceicoccus naphthovorans TaxID=1348774 RepID=A0A0G3XJK7_9SPHN|nr:EamA family transporter RarD [Croceicoccus naphthovorans]AKM10538.1 membrane protein [Croceicoccus naphthovorans]MBB3988735.1 chloramphenicol-sensitive protein RarD [Croceicoccus naphthovorans]